MPIQLPYDIVATIHLDGVFVQTEGTWVENDTQAAGLRSILSVVGKALEHGADVPPLRVLVAQMVEALRENRIGVLPS